jgi:hypothetical protein
LSDHGLQSFYRFSRNLLDAESGQHREAVHQNDVQAVMREKIEIDIGETDRTGIWSRSMKNNLKKR